jgi:hypothetical protein
MGIIVDCGEMRTGLAGLLLLVFLCRFNGEVIPSNWGRCAPMALKDHFDGDWAITGMQLRDKTLSANPSSISLSVRSIEHRRIIELGGVRSGVLISCSNQVC